MAKVPVAPEEASEEAVEAATKVYDKVYAATKGSEKVKLATADKAYEQSIASSKIPKTRVSSLDFMELELPVAMAVVALRGEDPWSSGFHGALNQRWAIVFKGKASDRAVKAAEAAGLEISYREAPKGSGQILTDVSLPGVGISGIEKATQVFNRFAELYESKPSYLKEPFVQVGDKVRFIGSSRGRFADWPEGKWLEYGATGVVKEYHPEQPAVRVGGEYFEALPHYAVVRWDFGGNTVIDPEDEGKRWERDKPILLREAKSAPESSKKSKNPYSKVPIGVARADAKRGIELAQEYLAEIEGKPKVEAVAPEVTARDYWDANLENNPLRMGAKDTDAGAFLAKKIENAGDILREAGNDSPDIGYIIEKIGAIRRELKSPDWAAQLSHGEWDRLVKTKRLLTDLPTNSDFGTEVKQLIRDITQRDTVAIAKSLGKVEELVKTSKPSLEVNPMSNKATVIKVDGTEQLLDHRPSLKEAQKIVGGYIELLHLKGQNITLVLDEEGKLKGKPVNRKASLMFKPWVLVGDIIVLEGWRTVGGDEPSMLKEPVKPGRVEEIERHQLSDGGFARITRLGHHYTFTRGFPSLEEPPEVTMDLTLDQARKLLADTLRSDVLESEGSFLYQQSPVLHSPTSPHCEAVLAKPPPCEDFRGIRSYVLCKAWDLMEKEKRAKLPVAEAWREARKVCEK